MYMGTVVDQDQVYVEVESTISRASSDDVGSTLAAINDVENAHQQHFVRRAHTLLASRTAGRKKINWHPPPDTSKNGLWIIFMYPHLL